FIESDRGPWARRFQGAAFPEGRCFRANGSGGHCLGGTSTGSSGELPGAISSSWCSTFPEARRSRGGGGSERVGRRVGALPGRDEHRLVRGVAGGYFIELVPTFPGVRRSRGWRSRAGRRPGV